ncbi:MAG: protein kinase [Planctomycetales bacterium]|nr:protein kinase [Planctomycetales bacterium]
MKSGLPSYIELCKDHRLEWDKAASDGVPQIGPVISRFLEGARSQAETLDFYAALVATDMEARFIRSFERRAETPPAILRVEDYLALGVPDLTALLVLMISEEAYWRKKYGDVIVVSEFIQRFPELSRGVVEDALRQFIGLRGPLIEGHDWERTIGEGGMGTAHLYWNREHAKHIALKIAKPGDEDLKNALRNEATKLFDLHHKNLIGIHELHLDAINPFYTMEFVKGGQHFGFEQFDQVAKAAFIQLADVLMYLHDKCIFHCDVKPSNVLVSFPSPNTVHVVLLDLGTAVQSYNGDRIDLTKPALRGSLPFMAPERIQQQILSAAGDWYSVGVLLYQTLTGRLPFSATTIQASVKEKESPPRPSVIRPSVPPELDELCYQLLNPDPESRPSGAALVRVLDRRTSLRVGRSMGWIGRKEEVQKMMSAFDAAFFSSTPQIIGIKIHGESGVGKTTTVEQFLNEIARQPKTIILRGKCYASGVIGAFDGFHILFSSLMEKMYERWGDDPQRLRSYLPLDVAALRELDVCDGIDRLLNLAGLGHASEMELPTEPVSRRHLALSALRDLLRLLARDFQLVLFVDDLQWSGADAAELIRNVFFSSFAPPCVLILAHRDGDPSRCLEIIQDEWKSHGSFVDMPLNSLNREQSFELLKLRIPDSLDTALVKKLVDVARGNPFQIELIARHYPKLNQFSEDAVSKLPSLQFDALDSLSLRVVELLALCDNPMSKEFIEKSCQLELEAPRVIRQLTLEEGLVRWIGQDQLTTFHDRYRNAALDRLQRDPIRLKSRAKQIASDLENSVEYRSRYILLARMQEYAGQTQSAGRYYRLAAETAVKNFSFDAASKYQLRAIELLQIEGKELSKALCQRAAYLGYAGKVFQSGAEYEKAANLLPPEERTEILCEVALRFLSGGYIEKGREALKRVFKDCKLRFPNSRTSWIHVVWQRLALNVFERKPLEEVQDIPSEHRRELDALWAGISGLSLIDPSSAADLRLRYVRRAYEFGSPRHAIRSLVAYIGFVSAVQGGAKKREADLLIAEILDLALRFGSKIGTQYANALCELAIGISSHLQGRWKNTVDACDRASQGFKDVLDANWERTTAQLFATWALLFHGDMNSMGKRFPPGYELAVSRQDVFAQLNYGTRVQAVLRLAEGRPEKALQALESFAPVLGKADFPLQAHNALLGRIQVELCRGNAGHAWALIRRSWTSYHRSGLHRVQHVFIDFWAWYGAASVAVSAKAPHNQLGKHTAISIRKLRQTRVGWASALATMLQAVCASLEAKNQHAIGLFELAEKELMEQEMLLHALVCKYARSSLQGQKLAEISQKIRDLGIADPILMARSLIPIDHACFQG